MAACRALGAPLVAVARHLGISEPAAVQLLAGAGGDVAAEAGDLARAVLERHPESVVERAGRGAAPAWKKVEKLTS